MKSERANEFIDGAMRRIVANLSEHGKWQLRTAMSHAAELAEQEAEERMHKKAIKAFKSSCLYQEGCLGAGMKCNPDKCEDLKALIQKLNKQ